MIGLSLFLDGARTSSSQHAGFRDDGDGVLRFDGSAALLHKSVAGQATPFPGRIYPTGSVTGMPRAV